MSQASWQITDRPTCVLTSTIGALKRVQASNKPGRAIRRQEQNVNECAEARRRTGSLSTLRSSQGLWPSVRDTGVASSKRCARSGLCLGRCALGLRHGRPRLPGLHIGQESMTTSCTFTAQIALYAHAQA